MKVLQLVTATFLSTALSVSAFTVSKTQITSLSPCPSKASEPRSHKTTTLQMSHDHHNDISSSRRSFFQTSFLSAASASTILLNNPLVSQVASADEENLIGQDLAASAAVTVQTPLYYILRVREAAEQESRLIKSGKFKDVQRANVKLAVKFMITNYKLNDNFIRASAFLEDGDKRVRAGEVGQSVVQNLYTILEYFDSSDVQNIKVGSDSMAGKEKVVLNGLDATRKSIDEFLSYFPRQDVESVLSKIAAENELNLKEFDPELGTIVNLKPTST